MDLDFSKKDFSKIDNVTKNDIAIIFESISYFFPYTNLNTKKVLEKLSDPNFFLIKFVINKKIVGFCELEYFGYSSRLNAIFVLDSFRRRGIAKKMVDFCFVELKKRNCDNFFLLVKENNLIAKKFYSTLGFKFKKIYKKKIDDSIIEVWEIPDFI